MGVRSEITPVESSRDLSIERFNFIAISCTVAMNEKSLCRPSTVSQRAGHLTYPWFWVYRYNRIPRGGVYRFFGQKRGYTGRGVYRFSWPRVYPRRGYTLSDEGYTLSGNGIPALGWGIPLQKWGISFRKSVILEIFACGAQLYNNYIFVLSNGSVLFFHQ